MANTVSLVSVVNTDDTATINDSTTFTSPTRNTVGVFLTVYKVNYLGVQTLVSNTSNTSDPRTASNWTYDIDTDGWYQHYYVSVPDYAGGTSYSQYMAVYDNSSKLVYRSKTNSNLGNSLSNTNFWELITDPTSLAANKDTSTESTNIGSLVYNKIIYNKVNKLLGDDAEAAAEECGGTCTDCTESSKTFNFSFFNVFTAQVAEGRQQFIKAERYIRRLDEFVGC